MGLVVSIIVVGLSNKLDTLGNNVKDVKGVVEDVREQR